MPAHSPYHHYDQQARRWLVRLSSGQLSELEMQQFLTWIAADSAHAAAFEHQRKRWKALEHCREILLSPQSISATGAKQSAPGSRARNPLRRPRVRGGMAIAAMLLVALVFPFMGSQAGDELRTANKPLEATLEDGTVVWLDAQSSLSVQFDAHERRVQLHRGSAWFNVTHTGDTRPMVVDAVGGRVRDLGTSFQVSLADRAVQTAVTEGSVEVTVGSSRRTLVAGQRVDYNEDGEMGGTKRSSPDQIATWRHGEIILNGVKPRDAVERVMRYREGRVFLIGKLPQNDTVTAVFRVEHADEALATLSERLNLHKIDLPFGGVLLLANAP